MSFTIITTQANPLLRPLHERMPVIIPAEEEQSWLSANSSELVAVKKLLKPYPRDEMEFYPVSPSVNSPTFDNPKCLEPIAILD